MSQRYQFPYSVENLPASAWSSSDGTPLITPTGSVFPTPSSSALPTPWGSVRGPGPYQTLPSVPVSPLLSGNGTPSAGFSPVSSLHGSIGSAPRPSISLWPCPPPLPAIGVAPGALMVPSSLPSPFFPATPACTPVLSPVMSTRPTPVLSAVSSGTPTPVGTMRQRPVFGGPTASISSLDSAFNQPPGYVTANTSHYNLPFLPPPYRTNFVPSPEYIFDATEDFEVQNREYERQRLGIEDDEESMMGDTKCRCVIL